MRKKFIILRVHLPLKGYVNIFDMFFYLSKTLYFLLMPATLVAIGLLLGFFLRNARWKKISLLSAIALFFLFTNDFIINEIYLRWEVPPTAFADVPEGYDVGIVLTGIANLQKEPNDRVYFNKGADRIIHAIELYKRGKIRKILVSGGTGSLQRPDLTEANALLKVLQLFGVPEADIIIEKASRNTHENASYSAEILNDSFPNGRFLLITSAFHLRRAEACFEKVGIATDTFSTDFYTHPTSYTIDSMLLPNESAFDKWQTFIREILGIVAYKIAGYI